MKKILKSVAILLFASAITTGYAQTAKELKKEAKETEKALKKKDKGLEAEIKDNAVRDARKEAKALEKDGWASASGALPLDKQVEQSWKYLYESDNDGYPIYIVSTQTTLGGNHNAAKVQATAQAKVDIAGQISTEVASLIESQVSNEMISADEAMSLTSALQASKLKIQQTLGRTIPVMEVTRTKANGNTEVMLTVAYNTQKAIELTKELMKAELQAKGSRLASEVDKLL